MESIENRKRQGDAQNQCPCGEAIDAQLNWRCLQLLHLERVDNPQCEVVDEQKSDQLPAGLFVSTALSTDHVGDEQSLQCDL